jgi:hypothetical protein
MTDQEEIEQFTSIEETAAKNRGSQLLVILSVLVLAVGGVLSIVGNGIGFVLLIGGFVALFLVTAWSLRHWEWDR